MVLGTWTKNLDQSRYWRLIVRPLKVVGQSQESELFFIKNCLFLEILKLSEIFLLYYWNYFTKLYLRNHFGWICLYYSKIYLELSYAYVNISTCCFNYIWPSYLLLKYCLLLYFFLFQLLFYISTATASTLQRAFKMFSQQRNW